MRFHLPYSLLCFLLLPFAVPADLAQRWAQERAHPFSGQATDDERALFSGKQAVLVGGYLGEAIGVVSEYFSDNVNVLEKEFGIACTTFSPPSAHSQQENAEQLARDIENLYQANGHKAVILIGHSKGGAESLLMALQHPELLHRGVLDRVILVQAAVTGSPIADQLYGGPLLAPLLRSWQGLRSLNTAVAREQFSTRLAALRSSDSLAYRLLAERTYYVRSYKNSSDVTAVLLVTHAELAKQGGSNDGLLLTSGQLLPDFGTDLGILYADHADLTVTRPLSTEDALFRYAFTRALLRELY